MAKKKSTKRDEWKLFHNIGELYTFTGVAKKKGRRVTDEDLGCIKNAAMVSRNGRIEWVGSEDDLPEKFAKKKDLQEENMRGAGVIPAFVECHTHAVFAGNRSAEFERRLRGESYQSIAASGGGILSTVRATREASEAQLAKIAQKRIDRFIDQGVTTVEVKSGYGLSAESELKMLRAALRLKGARVVPTFLGAHAIPPEAGSAEAYIDYLIEEVLPLVRKEKLARRADIFVEKGYFLGATAEKYLRAVRELGFQLAVHADQLSHSGGAELAVRFGAKSAEHLIEIDENDIKKLAASEVTCVLLPTADLYMKCSYPPARKLIDNGARVALATDLNPGTAPSQDLALVGVLARLEMKMTLPEVLSAYTVGAAHALGLENELGSLSEGKLCDFCGLEGGLDELFYEVGRQPIKRVYREAQRLR